MSVTKYSKLKVRRNNSSDWEKSNYKLDKGELGCEIDTHKIKVGDGTKKWSELPYAGGDTLTDGQKAILAKMSIEEIDDTAGKYNVITVDAGVKINNPSSFNADTSIDSRGLIFSDENKSLNVWMYEKADLHKDNTFTRSNTFNNPVIVAEPTADDHAATKKYVDDADNKKVNLEGTNTISAINTFSGKNTFNGTITVKPITSSSSDNEAVNKKYVDDKFNAAGNVQETTVENNLDSENIENALSANMGRELNSKIKALDDNKADKDYIKNAFTKNGDKDFTWNGDLKIDGTISDISGNTLGGGFADSNYANKSPEGIDYIGRYKIKDGYYKTNIYFSVPSNTSNITYKYIGAIIINDIKYNLYYKDEYSWLSSSNIYKRVCTIYYTTANSYNSNGDNILTINGSNSITIKDNVNVGSTSMKYTFLSDAIIKNNNIYVYIRGFGLGYHKYTDHKHIYKISITNNENKLQGTLLNKFVLTGDNNAPYKLNETKSSIEIDYSSVKIIKTDDYICLIDTENDSTALSYFSIIQNDFSQIANDVKSFRNPLNKKTCIIDNLYVYKNLIVVSYQFYVSIYSLSSNTTIDYKFDQNEIDASKYVAMQLIGSNDYGYAVYAPSSINTNIRSNVIIDMNRHTIYRPTSPYAFNNYASTNAAACIYNDNKVVNYTVMSTPMSVSLGNFKMFVITVYNPDGNLCATKMELNTNSGIRAYVDENTNKKIICINRGDGSENRYELNIDERI